MSYHPSGTSSNMICTDWGKADRFHASAAIKYIPHDIPTYRGAFLLENLCLKVFFMFLQTGHKNNLT